MRRTLIINADDFGYSEHTVDWTIKCFEAGVLSSATIMVGALAVRRAVEFARNNPQWSFGLHLCLTDERPICHPSEIPSMVTDEGLLWPTRVFMLRSSLGLIKREHLEREIRAQVKRLSELGVEMSHLDGHGHMHRMPFVLKSLIGLSTEMGLERIRPAQDLYYSRTRLPFGKWMNERINKALHKSFKAPAHFLMTSGKVCERQADWFAKVLSYLPDGCSEIGVHPGVDVLWRKLDTCYLLDKGKYNLSKSGIPIVTYYSCLDGK